MTSGASGIGLALGFCLCGRRHEVMLAEIEAGQPVPVWREGPRCPMRLSPIPIAWRRRRNGLRNVRRGSHSLHKAGVAAGGIDHMSLENWRWLIDVNLMVGQLPDAYSCAWRGGHSVNSATAGIINGMGFSPCAASKLAVVEHALSGICAHQDRHSARNCLARSGRAPALDPKSPAAALVGEIDMRVEVGLIRPMLPRAFLQPPGEPQIAICTPRLIVALPQSTLPWTMLQADRKCSGRRAVKRLFHGQTDARYRQLPV